ncbi:MAG: hypothetical protein LBK94_09360 [Prevotellaceae bacterium]|jgi:hypothetical protein|nr:hypothetical protein [Prevotellaceae bacterium]
MKKHLFIIISLFVFAVNVNAVSKIASATGYSISNVQNNRWGYLTPTRFTRGELSRIGGAIVHKGHKDFFASPVTQRAITYLSLITPIGEGVSLIGGLIRTGAKFLAKQMVKEGIKDGSKLAVQFGKTKNQIYHAFRHTDALGLDRSLVQSTIQDHFKTISSQVISGKPFNQIIEIGGKRIQYTVYKLPNGVFNIGRIHGIK